MPAYNEEGAIRDTVLALAEVISKLTDDYEIVVTNDGSRDGTGFVLAQVQSSYPDLPLRVVTHTVNQGYGAALASGFNAAAKSLIFFTDSDRQFDVRQLADLLAVLDDR